MEDEKTTYRADIDLHGEDGSMTWNPGCPILFEEVEVLENASCGAFLIAKARNIGAHAVCSFDAAITLAYHDGTTEEVNLEVLCCDIAPGCVYESPKTAVESANVVSSCASVQWTRLSNGSEWVSSAPPEALERRTRLNFSAAALSERAERLSRMGCRKVDIATRYAFESHDGWFRCPCGQLNVGLEFCQSCGLAASSPSHLDDEALLELAAREKEARSKEARDIDVERGSKTRLAIWTMPKFLLKAFLSYIALLAISFFGQAFPQHMRYIFMLYS